MKKDDMNSNDWEALNEFVPLPGKKKDHSHASDPDDLNEFIPLPNKKKINTKNAGSDYIYQSNLKALGKHHPELVDTLESVNVDEERMQILQSESGNPRIVCKREDGQEVNIHSIDDPVECANNAIDLLGKIEKEGIVVLFGFGLGYFAEEIVERFEKGHILLIYEAAPEIFKLALRVKDFTELLGSEKVKIILGEDADNFSVIHSHHHLISNGKFWVVEHKPSVKFNQKAYEKFFRRLNEEKSLSDIGVATNVRRGKEFMDACFMNLHSVIRKPGVAGLKDIFKGCTAIIVSAGPSLDRNIHLLKKAKGRAVIIATGGALPTLLSCDIAPDLVVEIDPVTDNIEDKFQGIPELKNVPFICLAQYTPELVNVYPGPLFINSVSGNIAFVWLKNFWEEKGTIECFGGSVAHLAFATAEYIGADVIAFVGQDLSYKNERMHTAGYSDDLDRRLKEAEEKKQENILNGIPVRDIFGDEVLTIPQFMTFITSFENRIKGSGRVIINATEGGLSIHGATNMRLMDFIDEYCGNQKEIDTFSTLSGLLNSEIKCNLEGLLSELSMAREKYESVKRAAKKILKYTKRVKKLKGKENKDSPELSNILKKIEKLIENVRHPSLNILVGYNYGLELYMKKQEVQDIDEIEDQWEMLDKQIERGQIYYNEIIKTISSFNKKLDKAIAALEREKKVDSILNDMKVEEGERFYRAANLYIKDGITAQAVAYLELAAQRYTDHDQTEPDRVRMSTLDNVYISLAEMYIHQYRFYEARDILIRFMQSSHGPDVMNSKVIDNVKGMLKNCDKKIAAWQEKKSRIRSVFQTAEELYGSHMESGYFYFRIKDFNRAEKSYLKAIETGDQQGLAEAYYGLAHTYIEKDDHENAVHALEKAIETNPLNPMPYRDLGLIAIQNNNIEPAEIFLAKAIELAPFEAELYKPLASLYMEVGEKEKAFALYENALKNNADNNVIKQDLAAIYKEAIAEAEGA